MNKSEVSATYHISIHFQNSWTQQQVLNLFEAFWHLTSLSFLSGHTKGARKNLRFIFLLSMNLFSK